MKNSWKSKQFLNVAKRRRLNPLKELIGVLHAKWEMKCAPLHTKFLAIFCTSQLGLDENRKNISLEFFPLSLIIAA